MTATQVDKKQEDRERLEAATRGLLSSEGWQRWLDTRSKFHAYSLGNQLLIAFQNPEATQVAGYKTWQKLGRQVLKGEKGLKILAPCMTGKKECPDCGVTMQGSGIATCPKCGLSTNASRVFFKSVSVFDISQTEGDELPQPPRAEITGQSHMHYLPRLEAYAKTLGYSVDYRDTGTKGGWCDLAGKEIVVSDSKPRNGQVRTLIHEIAHAHGIDYKAYTRDQAEVIVESVAYIVSGSIGLDTSGETVAYVASWGEGDDLKALKAFAGVIDEIARKIEAAILPKKTKKEEVAA